jgi:peptidoglycan/xylan/chitin deacetylase (PgdA/CDA1 family)
MSTLFPRLTALTGQEYERYLPSSFDDSLTITQKLNKVLSSLNDVIELSNSVADVVDANDTKVIELRDEFEVLREWLETEGLHEQATIILTEWFENGKLEDIISTTIQNDYMQSQSNFRGGLFGIVDDDSYANFMTRWKPVADSKGIKLSVAVNTSWVGTSDKMSLTQLKQLKTEGYDILSHGYTHPNMNTASIAELENEWILSKEYLLENGLGDDLALVYPVGLYDVADANKVMEIKTLTRKHYKYGLDANASTKAINSLPVDNYEVLRMYVNPGTVTLTYMKPYIDEAYAQQKMLLLLTHCGYQWDDVNSPINLGEIIDYVKSLNMPILTFREAEKLVGNVMSHGDSRTNNYHFVSKNGASWKKGLRDNVLPMSVTSMNALITEYEKYKVFRQQISNVQDSFMSTGGVLETYRGDSMFSYQVYYPAQRQSTFRRSYNDTTQVWSSWSESGANEAEVAMTMVNGWGGTLSYQKSNGLVTLKGSITVGTNTSTIIAGALPAGYRPVKNTPLSVYAGTRNVIAHAFSINANGNIITTASNGLIAGEALEVNLTYKAV